MTRLFGAALLLIAVTGCENRPPPNAPDASAVAAEASERAASVRRSATNGLQQTRESAAAEAPQLDAGGRK